MTTSTWIIFVVAAVLMVGGIRFHIWEQRRPYKASDPPDPRFWGMMMCIVGLCVALTGVAIQLGWIVPAWSE